MEELVETEVAGGTAKGGRRGGDHCTVALMLGSSGGSAASLRKRPQLTARRELEQVGGRCSVAGGGLSDGTQARLVV